MVYAGDSNDQLADKITTLAGQINAVNYRFLKMIAELDRRREKKLYESRDVSYFQDDELLKEEKLTFPQRRADALVAITEGFLAASVGDETDVGVEVRGLAGRERCQLVLPVHHSAVHNQKASKLDASLDQRWLLPDAARRLACDASLWVVEQDDVGNVLNIGRRSRIIPVSMSRALAVRDGGCCQFPGCCESRFVEGDHIKHWADVRSSLSYYT